MKKRELTPEEKKIAKSILKAAKNAEKKDVSPEDDLPELD